MGFYPLLLELAGRPCFVVGGGPVGERKVEGLLAVGAVVTVVSPELTPGLSALAQAGRITVVPRAYREGDLEGAALVFTALGDPRATAAVADEARRRAIWLNAADDPAHCTFILPAVVRRGALTISVASGGATPALTRALREHLEGALGPEWATLAELAAEARRELRATGRAVDGETWRRALAADVRALVAERRLDDARRELRTRLAIPV
ncbi:MAG: siroheme synthase [Candidatus Rokuibacteriota bacterium]|nr:MAG: siroheme synthase [Candidatus Rokubacteria bacterium]